MREVALSAMASLWIGTAIGAAFAQPGSWWWMTWALFGGVVVWRFVRARKESVDG